MGKIAFLQIELSQIYVWIMLWSMGIEHRHDCNSIAQCASFNLYANSHCPNEQAIFSVQVEDYSTCWE